MVQFASSTDRDGNRATVDALLGDLARDSYDLVVLPEGSMCDFGPPSMDLREQAEPLDGPFVTLLAAHARRLGATIVAGMFEATNSLPFNTLVALSPAGELIATYRKIHLYDSFGYRESERLSPGEIKPVVIPVAGLSVGLMTCYDLRFPELARKLVSAGAEAIVMPSAWVKGSLKIEQWQTLVKARAIENTLAMVAVDQCGKAYIGHSLAVDARGSILGEAGDEAEIVTVVLDGADIATVREENPSLRNRRMVHEKREGPV